MVNSQRQKENGGRQGLGGVAGGSCHRQSLGLEEEKVLGLMVVTVAFISSCG